MESQLQDLSENSQYDISAVHIRKTTAWERIWLTKVRTVKIHILHTNRPEAYGGRIHSQTHGLRHIFRACKTSAAILSTHKHHYSRSKSAAELKVVRFLEACQPSLPLSIPFSLSLPRFCSERLEQNTVCRIGRLSRKIRRDSSIAAAISERRK